MKSDSIKNVNKINILNVVLIIFKTANRCLSQLVKYMVFLILNILV